MQQLSCTETADAPDATEIPVDRARAEQVELHRVDTRSDWARRQRQRPMAQTCLGFIHKHQTLSELPRDNNRRLLLHHHRLLNQDLGLLLNHHRLLNHHWLLNQYLLLRLILVPDDRCHEHSDDDQHDDDNDCKSTRSPQANANAHVSVSRQPAARGVQRGVPTYGSQALAMSTQPVQPANTALGPCMSCRSQPHR